MSDPQKELRKFEGFEYLCKCVWPTYWHFWASVAVAIFVLAMLGC